MKDDCEVIVRTEEEILTWISEQQDYFERQMNKTIHKQSAGFNQWLGAYDHLQELFEYLTGEE